MSIQAVILRNITGTYTVTRRGVETYVDGVPVDAEDPEELSVPAVIQPASGRDLQQLSEGQHATEVRKMFTVVEMRTRTPAGACDVVTIDGEPWDVVNVSRWQARTGTHYESLISRRTIP
jgi:hypothetical protein